MRGEQKQSKCGNGVRARRDVGQNWRKKEVRSKGGRV